MTAGAGSDHTRRFTDHAEYYAAYRPGYPDDVWEQLHCAADVDPHAVIVDMGSGTGLSAELFLRHGHPVIGVEPNAAMRRSAEALLRYYPGFRSVNGTAERSTLPDACADVIVAASAFHWFDPDLAPSEFARILRPHGLVIIIRHRRRRDGTLFMRAFDRLCRKYAVPTPVREHQDDRIHLFFAGCDHPQTMTLEYTELLDYDALKGRLLSYSSIPLPGQERYDPMIRKLRDLFDKGATDDQVAYHAEVTMHWARRQY